jgi:nucleoside-triphosphatase
MKKNIFLCGIPGIGKTTLIMRAVSQFPPGTASGFYTQEIREGKARRGFAVVTLMGEQGVLAHVDIHSCHRVGKYGVDVAGFEALALPAIDPARVQASLIVIDEIGKMECFSSAFRQLVLNALDSSSRVLATVPLHGNSFVEALKARPDVQLIHVTPANRENLAGSLIVMLGQAGPVREERCYG